MKTVKFSFKADDNKEIFAIKWIPGALKKVRGIVQIAHGMAEHKERYQDFAKALTEEGFAVYINDHRGHGETAGSVEAQGYFADENGWNLVVKDMHILSELAKKENPSMPLFLIGHSMGSMLARSYIMEYGSDIKGVILSGTSADKGLLGKIGLLIAKNEIKKNGPKAKSPKLDKLSFGSFNKAFAPNRTSFDWLSRDESVVDEYVKDPFCGAVFSAGFFYDMIFGLAEISSSKNIRKIPRDMPIYLFSGALDPVGDNTKGVMKVLAAFKKAGIKDVSCKFYKDGRHEMLNELNKEDVFKDVINWIKIHM